MTSVLHVTHHFKPFAGGIEKFVFDLSKHQQETSINASVVCLNQNPGSNKKLPETSVEESVKVERVPFIDLKYYKLAPGILKKARESQAEIIHIHNIGFLSDYLLLAKRLGLLKKKIIVNTHGGVFHTRKLSLAKKIYVAWLKYILNQADKVIADSKGDYAIFSKIVRKEKLILLENGVELTPFLKVRDRKQANRFLFVGRIARNKKVDRLINTFSKVKEKTKLIIAGKDTQNLLPELKKEVKRLNLNHQIHFTGELTEKELLDEFACSEFFVSSSEYEGFGLSAIEAMAAGIIPLLNDIEAFRNFVENGINGFLIDFSKPQKAADQLSTISKLNAIERKKLAKNAKASVKKFDWQFKIKEFTSLYNECLKART